jgi:hypothetical protein
MVFEQKYSLLSHSSPSKAENILSFPYAPRLTEHYNNKNQLLAAHRVIIIVTAL